ncbi:MAG TPA: hypothetical protein VGF59_25920 [Bryobacteraceae bacterium]|jgi:hypothetical protein
MQIRITCALLAVSAVYAQQQPGPPPAPQGSIQQATTVTATAATISCSITNKTPATTNGVHIECKLGDAKALVLDSLVPTGSNAMVGSYGDAENTVSWIISQPALGGPLNYSISANGVGKTGTF